jgi:hypothetical protein
MSGVMVSRNPARSVGGSRVGESSHGCDSSRCRPRESTLDERIPGRDEVRGHRVARPLLAGVGLGATCTKRASSVHARTSAGSRLRPGGGGPVWHARRRGHPGADDLGQRWLHLRVAPQPASFRRPVAGDVAEGLGDERLDPPDATLRKQHDTLPGTSAADASGDRRKLSRTAFRGLGHLRQRNRRLATGRRVRACARNGEDEGDDRHARYAHSRPCLRRRIYSCVRVMPSCREALALLPSTSLIERVPPRRMNSRS